MLYAVHQKKVIILIDEYDVPLQNAWLNGFYDEMVDFIRSLFDVALKTNDSLEFGVLTGCLRISKESIFTGMNNLDVNSISDVQFSEYFGFTDEEVQQMLKAYGLEQYHDTAKQWYTKNSCNIKSKMLYYKWVMKDAKIQTNQNKIE